MSLNNYFSVWFREILGVYGGQKSRKFPGVLPLKVVYLLNYYS